jgi:glutamine synthetase
MRNIKLEYIWMDGTEPTKRLRSKIKVIETDESLSDIMPQEWGFDGSSTNQADGENSDLVLRPVRWYRDRSDDPSLKIYVVCEVMNVDGTPHETNTRSKFDSNQGWDTTWVGFEQEYTFFDGSRPLGLPEKGYAPPQGPFYCGVGADEVFGRDIVDDHLELCLKFGVKITGINAEVMPGQWEFQVGAGETLTMCDDLIMARYLLFKVGETYGINISLDPKPVRGDLNGAGCHVNFSTPDMRANCRASSHSDVWGMDAIKAAIHRLSLRHDQHIAVYGHGNADRLTGAHETCSINDFRWGVSDRGASIRIPWQVERDQCGYLEDRRPAANCDPYEVCVALLQTICGGS